jgi:hypothetical protein
MSNKKEPNDNFDLDQLNEELSTKSNSEIKAQLDELQRESDALDLEIKRESVAKIRAERANKLAAAQMRKNSTLNFLAQREATQSHCNHRKGGRGADAIQRGEGQAAEYAVAKHRLPHGKFMVLCLRCNKEWHPGIVVNGVVISVETPGYAEALNFPTDNTASGSSTFTFAAA